MRAEARPGGGSSAPATENRATVPESVDGRSRKREFFSLSAGFAAHVHLFVERRVSNVEDADDIAQQAMAVACAEMD
ncbi:MAG TPA: hypothetical protein VG496_15590, partial [Myxococcales bacterium]|nr:hypothetical protein [Myxococcales bacterium]